MEEKKTTFLSGIVSAIVTSIVTYVIINSSFTLKANDWLEALEEPAWFAWVLLIAVLLVPLIAGVTCGAKGCSVGKCLALEIGMEIAALIASFVIGFIAAILSLFMENVVGITTIISLFVAFTAVPTTVLIIIE